MACYELTKAEFDEAMVAFRADQAMEQRDPLYHQFGDYTPTVLSLQLWHKAAELVQRKGGAVPAEFRPKIWLSSGFPSSLTRFHLTTLKDEVPHG